MWSCGHLRSWWNVPTSGNDFVKNLCIAEIFVCVHVCLSFWFAVTPCVYLNYHQVRYRVMKRTFLANSYLNCRYSQVLRLWRICSNDSDFMRHSQVLKKHLVSRGHRPFIKPSRKSSLCLVYPYFLRTPQPETVLIRAFLLLSPIIPLYPPCVRLPVLTTISSTPQIASNVQSPRSLWLLSEGKNTWRSQIHSTGAHHKIRGHITCTTSNIIYLISCRICGIQYICETKNPLHAIGANLCPLRIFPHCYGCIYAPDIIIYLWSGYFFNSSTHGGHFTNEKCNIHPHGLNIQYGND